MPVPNPVLIKTLRGNSVETIHRGSYVVVNAQGETKISDAEELRYKESDRIALTVEWMRKAGAEIEELKDGMIINGNGRITGGKFSSHGDHRLAMTLGIASLISTSLIRNSSIAPPYQPAIRPMVTPMEPPTASVTIETSNEILAP